MCNWLDQYLTDEVYRQTYEKQLEWFRQHAYVV